MISPLTNESSDADVSKLVPEIKVLPSIVFDTSTSRPPRPDSIGSSDRRQQSHGHRSPALTRSFVTHEGVPWVASEVRNGGSSLCTNANLRWPPSATILSTLTLTSHSGSWNRPPPRRAAPPGRQAIPPPYIGICHFPRRLFRPRNLRNGSFGLQSLQFTGHCCRKKAAGLALSR